MPSTSRARSSSAENVSLRSSPSITAMRASGKPAPRDAAAGRAGIGAAEIADDPNAVGKAGAQRLRQHARDRRAVSERRIASPLDLAKRQRALGQGVEHQEPRPGEADELCDDGGRRVGAVAGKSGAAADADDALHEPGG